MKYTVEIEQEPPKRCADCQLGVVVWSHAKKQDIYRCALMRYLIDQSYPLGVNISDDNVPDWCPLRPAQDLGLTSIKQEVCTRCNGPVFVSGYTGGKSEWWIACFDENCDACGPSSNTREGAIELYRQQGMIE